MVVFDVSFVKDLQRHWYYVSNKTQAVTSMFGVKNQRSSFVYCFSYLGNVDLQVGLLHFLQSYDATSHFESTVDDVIQLYSKITGKVSYLSRM